MIFTNNLFVVIIQNMRCNKKMGDKNMERFLNYDVVVVGGGSAEFLLLLEQENVDNLLF